MQERYDASCGLYCGACLVLMARKRNNLKPVARMLKYKPEQLICYGCKSEKLSDSCSRCKIRPCAESKGHEFCIECDEFPCTHINYFHSFRSERPHIASIFGNLETIKKKGKDAWLSEQAKRWSCKKCGTSFSWYEETCEECGTELYNARDEAMDVGLVPKEEK
jgi:hypothetical protein